MYILQGKFSTDPLKGWGDFFSQNFVKNVSRNCFSLLHYLTGTSKFNSILNLNSCTCKQWGVQVSGKKGTPQ